jgi:hypothetical protein
MTRQDLGRGGRLRSRLIPLTVASLAVIASACAQEADLADVTADADATTGDVDFEATPEFVSDAAERSTGEPYRLEMTLAMDLDFAGESFDFDAPMMSGEQDGELSHIRMDMGPLMKEIGRLAPPREAFPPDVSDADLTMEIVADRQVMYLRAPMYEALADMPGAAGQLGPMGDLAALGDAWGRVDLAELGDVLPLNDVASAAGGQAADPRALLDLVAGTDDVDELGDAEVRGVTVHGLAAQVTLGELLEASGLSAEEFMRSLGRSQPAEAESLIDSLLDARMALEAWIDDDGYVRRMGYEFDLLATLAGVVPDQDAEGDAPSGFTYGITMDFFDYGDDSIAIEFPDPDEAVDVTDSFLELYAGPAT